MKLYSISFFIIFFFTVGCNTVSNSEKSFDIIDTTVHKDSLVLNGNEGNWYYKNKLYSGFAIKLHQNNSLQEKTGFYNGKKQGVYKVWFANGVLKLESFYHQNVLVGSYKTWWTNGQLASEIMYIKGKKNGLEKMWFADGTLSKSRNLENGLENGLQQAWLQNGKIYVNYEAKNGRIFGMKRATLCYQLKNEQIEDVKN